MSSAHGRKHASVQSAAIEWFSVHTNLQHLLWNQQFGRFRPIEPWFHEQHIEMEGEGQAIRLALPPINSLLTLFPFFNLTLMKSLLSRSSKRKAHKPVLYSDFGIPVFLNGFGIPASMRHLAPDYVNWVEPFGEPLLVPAVTTESFPAKHSGNTCETDSDAPPHPASSTRTKIRSGRSEVI